MTGKIENIDIQDKSIETTVNDQLEGLFNKFLSSDKKDELKNLDFNKDSRKTKAEKLFDMRLTENPRIISNLIDIDDKIEEKIENEVKATEIDLDILTNEVEIKQELIALKTQVETPTTDIPQLNKALTEIENKPDVPAEAKKTLKEYIEQGDYMGAITEAIDLIGDIFGGLFSNSGSIDEIYSNTLTNLKGIDFNNMNEKEIKTQIEQLKVKVDAETDINKKLSLTYVLSTFKKQLTLKTNPKLNEYQILEQNITKGTVLLINKQTSMFDGGISMDSVKSKIGSVGLDKNNDTLVNPFHHSVIVTQVNPIKITHSTMNTKDGKKGGGVEERDLQTYLNEYDSANILTLEMPQENKDKAVDYAKQKLGSDYDGTVAVSDTLGGVTGKDNPDKLNCVELIDEGLGEHKKDISDPNDFLKSDILKPTYMTTVTKS